MPRKSMPDLKSEAEEAAWYATPEGRRQTQREFERARKIAAKQGISYQTVLKQAIRAGLIRVHPR